MQHFLGGFIRKGYCQQAHGTDLTGLYQPDAGQVCFAGTDLRDANPDEMSRPEEAIKRAGILREHTDLISQIQFDENGEDEASGAAILRWLAGHPERYRQRH